MKKALILIMFVFLSFVFVGCGDEKTNNTTMGFEQKIEILEDPSFIREYYLIAQEHGYEYVSFIDLRGETDVYDGYAKTKSYCYGYIKYFDCVTWKAPKFDSKLSKVMDNKPKTYPVLLIDYDGSYIEDAVKHLSDLGYSNIKAFKYGYFTETTGYIPVIGFSGLAKCEDCGC